jgi:hypothetical protein
VAKLDPTGSKREFLKYLGGTWGAGTGISLDSSGKVWVTGRVTPHLSTELFRTVRPFQAKDGGGFVSQIASDGSSLLFSSLMEAVQQMAVDLSGNVFVAGSHTPTPPRQIVPRPCWCALTVLLSVPSR